MIGVALVSAAAVFASSLRDTFGRVLDRAVTADYVITDESFQGLPPTRSASASLLWPRSRPCHRSARSS